MLISEAFLQQKLEQRKSLGTYRELCLTKGLIDFCSNDYLGFARSAELKRLISHKFNEINAEIGSTGSRLLTGNSAYAESLEQMTAAFHSAETSLIFNSGYDANLGLFSALLQDGVTLIYDELIHASVRDGIRLGKGTTFSFNHNDLNHLEARLKNVDGVVFVAVESVYSMDGDFAKLPEIVELCQKYGAQLIVDEAHATGLYGEKGEGKTVELGLQELVFARVHTFGKSLGVHGAAVLGSNTLKEFLVNHARSFIYTTALGTHSLVEVDAAYQLLRNTNLLGAEIAKKVNFFKNNLKLETIPSTSQIQSIIIKGNQEVKQVARKAQQNGFDIRPILSPTVSKGKERIRVCLHAFNTENEIEGLTNLLNQIA